MLARVLDDLLRMSEGKEHASSLADLKDMQLQRQIKIKQTNTDSKDYRPSKLQWLKMRAGVLVLTCQKSIKHVL